MKKFTIKKFLPLPCPLMLSAGFVFSAVSVPSLFGQNFSPQEVQYKQEVGVKNKQLATEFDEQKQRDMMKADGVPSPTIDKIIAQRKLLWLKGKTIEWSQLQKKTVNPVPMAACSDMGGENGWGAWQGTVGTSGPPSFPNPLGPPTAPNFVITAGAGNDACTPGPNPGDPPIPVVCPATGFGNASLQIGQLQTNGCVAEQMTYPLTVTNADTNFIYAYAMVIEDPGHDTANQPNVSLCIYDTNGNPVPCGCFVYRAAANLPGFYTSSCVVNSVSYYKPWTIVGVNLSNYVGQTLTVVITNIDCGYCGHFAHSYWDFQCPPVAGSSTPFCLGQQTTLCAPPSDPTNPYTYQWYQNGNILNGQTAQCAVVTPQVGDTFVVHVMQASGCDFYIPFIPSPTTILPDFTFAGTCGNMTFTDISTVSPVSATNTVVSWNWQFPGGSPASSTLQNPGTIVYPPGTYTVTLIVTSTAGCTDTIQHTVVVGGFPQAIFTSNTPCLGSSTVFNDASIAQPNDPIVAWSWSFPGGTPATSTSQNPSVIYTTAGSHTVTLVVTSAQGCQHTVVQVVNVHDNPIALFSDSAQGCRPLCVDFTNLSTSADGNITNLAWGFPGGNPSSSTQSDPPIICYDNPGNYNVSLYVETQYGCWDTIQMNNYIHVYAWPDANFCVIPNQASVNNPLFSFCDLWTSDVTQWIWDFGDGSPQDISSTDPVHSYSTVATNNDFYSYTIFLYVENQYGCWDTITKVVELLPEFTFYIPNCVTPNGDFINEFFFGKSRGVKEYNIWLFDRWGNLIWDCHREDKNTNWDKQGQDGLSSFCKWDSKVVSGGMDMNGNSRQLAQEDVYVWKVKLTDVFDKKHSYIGHVSIVK